MATLHATSDGGRTIRISADVARALAGGRCGGTWWAVTLHGLPGWTFRVDAATMDGAQAAALAVARAEGRCLSSSGATMQRVSATR